MVRAKDTPNFIANRIGTFSMLTSLRLMAELGMTIEEVDACTGPAIGWPKSATFRTADIVGLDVLAHVVRNIYDNAPDDESRELYRIAAARCEEMVRRGWLGEKTGRGFYQRVKKGGDSRNPHARSRHHGISPAPKSALRLHRSGALDRRHSRTPARAARPRARRSDPATRPSNSCGR